MWNLSLNDVLAAKEELTGRRAAVKARYEKDMQAIEDDLKNILALESAANLFLKSHKPEDAEADAQADPSPFEETGSQTTGSATEAVAEAQLPHVTEPQQPQHVAELEEVVAPDAVDARSAEFSLERKVNRWRIR